MNTKTITLSSTSSSFDYVMDTQILNDATIVNISMRNIYEDVLPLSLSIDWGDGVVLYYDNDLYKKYREESIFDEILKAKFSAILQKTYSYQYYPSKKETYKNITAQFLFHYSDKNKSLITVPFQIKSSDYFESVYDMKMISTNIAPLATNNKNHTFITSKGGYIVESNS